MKRLALIGGSVLVALIVIVVGVLVFVLSNLNDLIEAAVEREGGRITQVEVSLDEADVSPESGAGALRGLTIGNPQGYRSDHLLALGEISLQLDTDTLLDDVVVVREIVIAAPDVIYELGEDGTTNIDVVQANVDRYVNSQSGGNAVGPEEDSGKKLIVEHLYIRDGRVGVSAAALGGKSLSAPLPSIHLTDLGSDSDGATPGEIANAVIDAIAASATRAVGTLDLEGLVKGAEGTVKDALEKTGEGASGAGGAVRDGVKKLFE